MPKVIHPESHLKALAGLPLVTGQAGVVDQQVQRQLTCQKQCRTFAHRVQVVKLQRQEKRFVGCFRVGVNLVDHRLCALCRAPCQKHCEASLCQAQSGDAANADIGAGDEGNTFFAGGGVVGAHGLASSSNPWRMASSVISDWLLS